VVPLLPAPSPVSPQPTTALLITTSTPVTVGQSLAHPPNQVSALSVTLKPAAWDHLNLLPLQLYQILTQSLLRFQWKIVKTKLC
jgi:hypothetical protein